MAPDLTLMAGIAGVTALWSQIRGVFERIRALFICRVTIAGDVGLAVANYLWARGKVLNWGDRFVTTNSCWVRPLDRYADIAIERAPIQPLFVWLNRRPLLFHCPTHPDCSTPQSFDVITVTSLRGCLDIVALTRDALAYARSFQTTSSLKDRSRYRVRRIGGRRQVYGGQIAETSNAGSKMPLDPQPASSDIRPDQRFLHWRWEDLGMPNPAEPFASLALCEAGAAARADFQRWLGLKAWYQERGIPWRRGHLYHGPPGTGKTSLARALAQEAGLPVFAYDLSTLDNEQFTDAWQSMQEETPCLALIEDIDGTFHGRTNVRAASEQRDVLTFDCLLNALGGIQTCDGVFLIVTTNKPELMDEALCSLAHETHGTASRPGRIDRSFCLGLPAEEQRVAIVRRICGTCGADEAAATVGMSAAQVTEYAITRALEATWNP
jgi:hypothetical protein